MTTTIWAGYVQGTNRGKAFVHMKSSNETLTGDIVFKDIAYGTAAAKIKGKLNNSQVIDHRHSRWLERCEPLKAVENQGPPYRWLAST